MPSLKCVFERRRRRSRSICRAAPSHVGRTSAMRPRRRRPRWCRRRRRCWRQLVRPSCLRRERRFSTPSTTTASSPARQRRCARTGHRASCANDGGSRAGRRFPKKPGTLCWTRRTSAARRAWRCLPPRRCVPMPPGSWPASPRPFGPTAAPRPWLPGLPAWPLPARRRPVLASPSPVSRAWPRSSRRSRRRVSSLAAGAPRRR